MAFNALTAIKTLSMAIVATLAVSVQAQQNIVYYETTGAHGETLYTQLPPTDGRTYTTHTVRVDGRQNIPGQLAGETSDTQQQATPAADARVAELERQIKQQEEARRLQECQSLHNNLQNLNSNGRIYETDAQGNRNYLDKNAIADKRTRIQQAIDQHCQ